MRRLLTGVLVVIGAILLLFGAAFAYAQTPLGKQQIGDLIGSNLSGEGRTVEVEGIEGLIPFSIRVGRVRLADDRGTWLEVDDARVGLRPADLLAGRVHLDEVGAERVRVERTPDLPPSPPEPPSDEPFALPTLPESLPVFAADRLYVNALELGPELAGQEARFKLEGGARTNEAGSRLDANLDLVRTDADTASASLKADVDLGGRTLDLALKASETGGLIAGLSGRPEAGDLSVDLTGRGPFSDIQATLRAEARNLAVLQADLGLAVEGMPRIDLDGHLEVAQGVLPEDVAPLVGSKVDVKLRGGQREAELYAFEEIDIRGGAFALTGDGTARLDSRELDGRLSLDLPSLDAASALAGIPTGGSARIDLTASGDPMQPVVKAQIDGQELVVDTIGIAALQSAIDLAVLGPLDQGWGGARLGVEGGADGVTLDGEPLPAAPAPRWGLAATVPAEGEAQIERFELNAEALTLRLTGAIDQATLAGTARLELMAPDLAKVMASLGALAPPELALSGALQASADATIEPEAKQIAVDLALDGSDLGGLPPGAAELVGRTLALAAKAIVAPGQSVSVQDLSLKGEAVELGGNVQAGLADQTLGGDLSLTLPRLAALSEVVGQPIEGKASAKAGLGGTFERPAIRLDVTADEVKAAGQEFRRIALTGKAEGAPDDLAGDLDLKVTQPQGELRLTSGYQLKGQEIGLSALSLQGPATSLKGDIQVDLASLLASGKLAGGVTDLAALQPWHGQQLKGRVDLNAELKAANGKQDGRVRLDVNGVAGDFGEVGSLNLDAQIADALGTLGLDAKATLSGFTSPDVKVEAANLTAQGSLEDMRVAAEAKGDQQGPFDVATRARLQLLGAAKRVELSNLSGTYGGQTIELRAPATLVLDKGVLDLDQLDLRIGQARIQGNLETGNGRVRAAATLSEFPLSMLAAFGAPELDGTAGAELRLDGPLAAPRADLELSIPQLRPGGRGGRDLPPLALAGSATVSDGRLNAQLRLERLTASPITASLQLPMTLALEPFAINVPPEGRLQGRVDGEADLARLARYAALDGQRVDGGMTVALVIAGSVAQPDVRGRLELGPARVEDSVSGALFRDLRLVLSGDGNRIAIEELSARTRGNGDISGSGRVQLGDGFAHQLQLTARNAEVLRNDLGVVVLSGDLGLDGDSTAGRLEGRIEVQRADFQIPGDLGPSIPSLDVVEVGDGAPTEPRKAGGPPYDLTLDLAVDVPARFFVRGRGLDSEWGGQITAKGPAAAPQVLGELTFRRGFLDFLDRRFQIRKGVIAFSGASPPVPEIDVEAASQGEGILALINIVGPATKPELELTSEPPLPKDEVLARLLFDRDMSQLTPAQGLRLANAVATLEGNGIDLTGQFRRGLGLDTLDVGGESTDAASLRAGKYLADNVYFEMQQGVQAGSGKARLEVELTPNVNLSTEVDAESRTSLGVEWKLDY